MNNELMKINVTYQTNLVYKLSDASLVNVYHIFPL